MTRNISIILIVSSLLILMGGVGLCEENDRGCRTDWNPPSAGPVITWPAPLCGRGKFLAQPSLVYSNIRGNFDPDGHYDKLPGQNKEYQYQEQLFLQYGLTDLLEIDGQAAYLENYAREGDAKAHESGLGDSYMYLRYCAVDDHGLFPCITGMLQLKMPTGKYQHLDPGKLGTDSMGAPSGGGSWDPGIGIIFTKKVKPFIFHTDAIYNVPQQVRVDGAKTRYGDYINYDIAAEYFLPKGFNLMVEANWYWQRVARQDGEKVPDSRNNNLMICPGIGWSNEKIQTLLAYQRTLYGTNAEAADNIIATFVYGF